MFTFHQRITRHAVSETEWHAWCTDNARMSHHNRKGEPPKVHSRSDRVVLARGRWYLTTRERVDVGPYDTRESALIAAEQLGQALDGVDDPVIALAFIREFVRRRDAIAASSRLDKGSPTRPAPVDTRRAAPF